MKSMGSTSVRLTLRAYPILSVFLLVSVLVWMTGITLWMNMYRAHAAALNYVRDTISDSDLGVVANHEIDFRSMSGVSAGGKIEITFPASSTIPNALDFSDVDLTVAGASIDLAAAPSGAIWGVSTSTVGGVFRRVTITSGTGTIAANATTTVKVGLNATHGVAGDLQIINPNYVGSYVVNIITYDSGSAEIDSADTRFAIIDDVTMTASVDTTLSFTIDGVADSQAINGDAVTTATTTTATSMPFGLLQPNVPKTLGQQLSVSTNARNGFVVSVFQDRNMTSINGADIDLFIDGVPQMAPLVWRAPTGTLDQENTYGHYGITSEDNLNADEFGVALYSGVLSSSTPRAVFHHSGPADGTTANKGRTRVAIKIEIDELQESAKDYTNVLTYICTPSF